VSSFITGHFIPVEAHIKEHPAWFKRFEVSWTPSVLIMDPAGRETYRIEGYLPKPEFRAQLQLGLARVAFSAKKWSDAEKLYGEIIDQFPASSAAPEAVYWKGVSEYQRTHDHTVLTRTGQQLAEKYPGSVWTTKGSVWLS
jgi:outer membrane protein assembly factor BamD (BamD/ComL family)